MSKLSATAAGTVWFESLHRLTSTLNRITSRPQVCDCALDALASALDVTRSAVLLCDGDGCMRFVVSRGLSDDYRRIVEGHSPWASGADPRPFAIECAQTDPTLQAFHEALRREGIESLAFVPLLEQGRLIGKFMLYSDTRRGFSDAELSFAEAVGNHIAFAVERQRCIEAHERLQNQLSAAQRLESVGRLAGGVAHEFNNLLTAILGYVELGTMRLSADALVLGDLRHIGVAAERAMDLTRQLLAFARRQRVELQDVHLGELLQNLLRVVRRLLGERIEVVSVVAPDVWSVFVDRAQIEQVLLNLAVNARDAMPDGGRITIDLRNVSLAPGDVSGRASLTPGDWVQLMFEDDGAGMTDEVRAHVFEPFFTSNELGRGSGLGLSSCYGVVKQIGGHIEVEGSPGRGTRFWIWLPRAKSPVTHAPALRSRGTVLLVEDEQIVREMLCKTLILGGYSVLIASEGNEALRLAAEHLGEIDLLFTDMVMPHMGGRELAARLRATRPNLRVLFMSGYTDEVRTDGDGAFISKPFTPTAVLRRVAELFTVAGRDVADLVRASED